MTLAVATEQFRTDYLFHAPTNYTYNYVNIVAPTGATVIVDGGAVGGLQPSATPATRSRASRSATPATATTHASGDRRSGSACTATASTRATGTRAASTSTSSRSSRVTASFARLRYRPADAPAHRDGDVPRPIVTIGCGHAWGSVGRSSSARGDHRLRRTVGLYCLDAQHSEHATCSAACSPRCSDGRCWSRGCARWPARVSPACDRAQRLGLPGLFVARRAVIGTGIRLDPSPYLHGGQDQGIYVNVGHHIARTGRLRPIR